MLTCSAEASRRFAQVALALDHRPAELTAFLVVDELQNVVGRGALGRKV
jgi:hypothetical protein